jgi:hypothetical protein
MKVKGNFSYNQTITFEYGFKKKKKKEKKEGRKLLLLRKRRVGRRATLR